MPTDTATNTAAARYEAIVARLDRVCPCVSDGPWYGGPPGTEPAPRRAKAACADCGGTGTLRPTVHDPLERPLLPEDPNWPAPENWQQTRDLMLRLPHRTRVRCALSAAASVLPIFEAEHPTDLRPRKAIETVVRWLAGEAVTAEELRAAASDSYASAASSYASTSYAATASYAPANAAANANATASDYYAASAIDAASYAAASAVTSASAIDSAATSYARCWSDCRRALAVRDPARADIEWWDIAIPPRPVTGAA